MEAWIQQLISQSVEWALFIVAIVTFLESLAIVGLILPGTVIMATLGAMVGSGKIDLYAAWAAGLIGCLLGDWISFYLGWKFQGPLHRWKYLKKYQHLLDKTEHALHQHSMATLLIGRFVGPMRPLVPLVAGMLELPLKKFLPPNLIGCVLWPPVYLLPGIIAGVAIDVPANAQNSLFKWLLLGVVLLVWLAAWMMWRWLGKRNKQDWVNRYLPRERLRWLAPLMVVLAGAAFIALQYHPMMPVFKQLLGNVFFN